MTFFLNFSLSSGGYNKVVSKSPLPQPLSSANKLSSISLQRDGNNSHPPATSLSDSFLTNAKSIDRPKLNPLHPLGSGHQGSISVSGESTNNNKETKPVKGFLTDQKSISSKRKISDDRRRFLALLSRNPTKVPN